jgi:membrane protein DedA with SNARE-associated domain
MNNLFLSTQVQPLGAWTYVLLALLVAVEGPIMTLAGAVASSAGYLNPYLVFLSASAGNLTADVLWYSLGYLGKREWLLHYGRWFGITESMLDRIHQDIHNHIQKILFTAKLTLGFVIPTLVAAGLYRVPCRRWFGFLFLAECLWTGTLVVVGHSFGQYVQTLERDLEWISLGGAALFVVGIIVYIAYRHSQQTKGG